MALALRRIGRQSDGAGPTRPGPARALADADVRRRAAHALSNALRGIGPEAQEAVPALVKALADPDVGVRAWTAGAPGTVVRETVVRGAKDAIPARAAALVDSSPTVRASVARALVRIGPGVEGTIPALVGALDDSEAGPGFISEEVRRRAAEALGFFGPAAKEAIPALVKTLSRPDSSVRASAAIALGRIGPATKEVIPTLTLRRKRLGR